MPVITLGHDYNPEQWPPDVWMDDLALMPAAPAPTMTQTYASASDGFEAAVSGQCTLPKALQDAQASTVQTVKSQSIPVKE